MTHEDYTKKRDAITVSYGPLALEVSVDENAQKAIDALVLQVIGDNVVPANEYSVNWTDNNLKSEQRRIVTGDK